MKSEELRLECLKLAVEVHKVTGNPNTSEGLVELATEFYDFVTTP